MRDFLEILHNQDWYDVRNHNRSEHHYRLFGNTIEFFGIDQPAKVRGRKRNILFVNECNELSLESWRQLTLRTTDRIIIDYNPSDEYHWIYEEVIPRDDASFFKTTYLDNPYLSESVVAEIERLKETDENYWRVYGLGERGSNPATIFSQWHTCEGVPENAKLVAYGLDFGFSVDPSALMAVYQHDINLYIEEVMYRTNLTNTDMSEEFEKLGIGRQEIVADSAEPKSIEELFRLGWNVKPAKKGRDSVRQGIDIMKRYKLHIVKSSTNAQKEFRNYKWQVDRNGRPLNQPEDKWNHAVDAVRYVCLNKLATNFRGQYLIS